MFNFINVNNPTTNSALYFRLHTFPQISPTRKIDKNFHKKNIEKKKRISKREEKERI